MVSKNNLDIIETNLEQDALTQTAKLYDEKQHDGLQ